jgi:alpha-galactosidase
MEGVAEVALVGDAAVYEEGWQSWSAARRYPVGQLPRRPRQRSEIAINYRSDRMAPTDAYQGEGLLAVDPGGGAPVEVFALTDGSRDVPSITGRLDGRGLVVSADGPVEHQVFDGSSLEEALGSWGDGYAERVGVRLRPAPTIWCSWYEYFTEVTEDDIVENLETMDDLELPVDVVQIDDGYQSEIGDWLTLSDRFASLEGLADRIVGHGRRAGLWVAPFLVGSGSQVAADHPEWLVEGGYAGHNWNQELFCLDVTHPGAADYLRDVFGRFAVMGFDFFKLDFIYAGAIPGGRYQDMTGVEAYRHGVELIRQAVGDSYLLGCGAPVFPSVGLYDAMRVGGDIGATFEPHGEDLTGPSQREAAANVVARAWQQGRFWVNDPDCLVARPRGLERREEWAQCVERYGGLRGSSDRLRSLDEWGLEATRRLLATTPPPKPFSL